MDSRSQVHESTLPCKHCPYQVVVPLFQAVFHHLEFAFTCTRALRSDGQRRSASGIHTFKLNYNNVENFFIGFTSDESHSVNAYKFTEPELLNKRYVR